MPVLLFGDGENMHCCLENNADIGTGIAWESTGCTIHPLIDKCPLPLPFGNNSIIHGETDDERTVFGKVFGTHVGVLIGYLMECENQHFLAFKKHPRRSRWKRFVILLSRGCMGAIDV